MAMCYSRLYFLVWGADVVITFAPFLLIHDEQEVGVLLPLATLRLPRKRKTPCLWAFQGHKM